MNDLNTAKIDGDEPNTHDEWEFPWDYEYDEEIESDVESGGSSESPSLLASWKKRITDIIFAGRKKRVEARQSESDEEKAEEEVKKPKPTEGGEQAESDDVETQSDETSAKVDASSEEQEIKDKDGEEDDEEDDTPESPVLPARWRQRRADRRKKRAEAKKAKRDKRTEEEKEQYGEAIIRLIEAESEKDYGRALEASLGSRRRVLKLFRRPDKGALKLAKIHGTAEEVSALKQKVRKLKGHKRAQDAGAALGKCHVLMEEINAAEEAGNYERALELCRGPRSRLRRLFTRPSKKGVLGLAKKHKLSQVTALREKAKTLKKAAKEAAVLEAVFGKDEDPNEINLFRDKDTLAKLLGMKRDKKEGDEKDEEKDDTNVPTGGIEYMEHRHHRSFENLYKDSGDDFFENIQLTITLIIFLRDYYRSRQHGHRYPSLIEELNLDKDNLLKMYQAIFGNMLGRPVEEKDIAAWALPKNVNPLELLYSGTLGFHEGTKAEEIDKAIEQFNGYYAEGFRDWKKFASLLPKGNSARAIYNTMTAISEINTEHPDDIETIKDKRTEVIERKLGPLKKKQAGDRPKAYSVNRIDELLRNLERRPAKQLVDGRKARGYEELRPAFLLIDEIAEAFSELDETILKDRLGSGFDDKKRVELVKQINAAFPDELRLGTMLHNLKDKEDKDDVSNLLIQAAVEKLGITDEETLVATVQDIYTKLKELFPELGEQVLIDQLDL